MTSTSSVSGAPAVTPPSSAGSTGTIATNFSDFLTLLTTQLQNQDPTDPLDTNEFTTQLVQFALVEQQINANANLETLIALNQGQQVLQASSLIGTRVVADSSRMAVQDGSGEIRFASDIAAPTLVSVLDSTGRAIHSETVQAQPGENRWVWDGRGSGSARAPDGAWTVTVIQPRADGTTQVLPFGTVATVTGAQRSGSTMQVQLGALNVGLDAVTSVGVGKN